MIRLNQRPAWLVTVLSDMPCPDPNCRKAVEISVDKRTIKPGPRDCYTGQLYLSHADPVCKLFEKRGRDDEYIRAVTGGEVWT